MRFDLLQPKVVVSAVAPEEVDVMISRMEELIYLGTGTGCPLPACAARWSRLEVRGQADATLDKPC